MKDIITILTKITQIVSAIDKFVEEETKRHIYIENVNDDYDYEHDVAWSSLEEHLVTLERNMHEIDNNSEINMEFVHYSNNSFDITVNMSDYDTIFNHAGENVNQIDYKYSFYKKWSI